MSKLSQEQIDNLKKGCNTAKQNGGTLTISPDAILNILELVEDQDKALEKIAEYDVAEEHGGVDEWYMVDAFIACQEIARKAKNESR